MILSKLNWLGVDFDGTLVNTKYPDFTLGEPIHENVEKLKECVALGYKIIIHTARPWENHQMISKYLDDNNIPYDSIVCGKLLVHRYIDDRNIDISKNWADQL